MLVALHCHSVLRRLTLLLNVSICVCLTYLQDRNSSRAAFVGIGEVIGAVVFTISTATSRKP